ncbi:MAG: TlpA family protein disulfide reductase [Phycisphaerae bacterium]
MSRKRQTCHPTISGLYAVAAVLLGWVFVAPGLALDLAPGEQFSVLQRKLEAADSVWWSLTAQQRASKEDPRASLFADMVRVHDENATDPDAKSMSVAIFYWSLQIEHPDSPKFLLSFAKAFDDERRVVDMIYDAEMSFDNIDTSDQWLRSLQEIAQSMSSSKVAGATGFFTARIHLDRGHLKEAIKGLEAVASADVPEPTKERAVGLLNSAKSLQVGMVMPDFEATTLDGKKVKLSSLRDKVVLVDFWATWCGPCVAEFPNLQQAAKKYGEQFVILSISGDDSAATVKRFKKKKPLPGIVTWDGKNGRYPLMEKFNIEGLPTWYLLDSKGRIVAIDPFGKKLAASIDTALASKR